MTRLQFILATLAAPLIVMVMVFCVRVVMVL
jgi:hypothetical protein